MKLKLLLLTTCLMMALNTLADNKQAEKLYEDADAAYAQQDYK